MIPATWPHDGDTRARISASLAGHSPALRDDADLRRAAVVVALAPQGGQTSFLLTRRPETMSRHSGQYALPGGRIDPGETAEEAAIRELREELGVAGTVLGRLDELPTASGWLIASFVVWIDTPTLRPDPQEVAETFRVPLTDLFARQDQAPERYAPEPGALWHYMPSLGFEIYAPTAAILLHFRAVALEGRAARIEVFREPRFARE